jgi:hypothetical protein
MEARLSAPHVRILSLIAALMACVPARPAAAESQAGAQEIIDRWLAATGGREARDAERTVHMKGRLHAASLKGTYELWLGSGERWAVQIRLGSLYIRDGWDGETAWRTDLSNRTVRVLGAHERDEAREEGFFLHERWSEPGHGGATVRLGARAYGAEVTHDVLEVMPPVGRTQRFFVNEKTGLIDRVEMKAADHVSVERRGQYGRKDARRRHRTIEWGYPRWGDTDPEKLTIDSILVNRPFDESIFSPPELESRDITWLKSRGVARIPFRYGSQHVWVKVSVDGREPADFILDTGASLTAIDSDWAYQNRLPREGESVVQGMGGTGDLSFARVKSLRLLSGKGDGVRLSDFRAGLIDLGDAFEATMWRRPAGLLGSDFLSRFIVEIDYDSNLVILHDPDRWKPPAGVAPIEMLLVNNIPTVEMTLNDGCSGRFLVDVGNSFGLDMHGEAVRRCNLFRGLQRPRVEMYAGGIGGAFNVTMCRMDSVSLGPWTWPEPIVGLSLHGGGMVGSTDLAGNIGNGILEKFRCTFDYPGNRLWLVPGRRFEERDRLSRLGALLIRLPELVFVGSVVHGSPAHEAGIKLWDEVLEIDGRRAIEWTPEQLDRELEGGKIGSVHTLKVRRWRTDEHTMEVTLRDVL